jgi:hypothetical protein
MGRSIKERPCVCRRAVRPSLHMRINRVLGIAVMMIRVPPNHDGSNFPDASRNEFKSTLSIKVW